MGRRSPGFSSTRITTACSPVEERTADSLYVVSYAQADRMGLGAGQYYQMAKARTRVEFEAALAGGDLYPANLVAAGADGTVLFARPGAVPVRAPGLEVRGTLDGNTAATAWRGMHPYRELLKLVDPPQGYFANANNSPDTSYAQPALRPADHPPWFAFEPGRTNERQRRLIEILDGEPRLTEAQALAAVMDESMPAARPWGPKLRQALAQAPSSLADEAQRRCVDGLAAFDGVFSRESGGALAFIEMQRRLRANRELAERLTREVDADAPLSAASAQQLLDAAREACAALTARFGRADLVLGDVFRVGRGGVDLPIGTGQIPVGNTVRGLQFGPPEADGRQWLTGGQRAPFLVRFGPDGVRSFAQVLYGISEDPASPHHSDQAQLASEKRLAGLPLTREALLRSGAIPRRLH